MDEYKNRKKRGFNCIYSHDSVVGGGGNGDDDDRQRQATTMAVAAAVAAAAPIWSQSSDKLNDFMFWIAYLLSP